MVRRDLLRRMLTMMLCFVIAATFMPLLGDDVHGVEKTYTSWGTPVNSKSAYNVYHNYFESYSLNTPQGIGFTIPDLYIQYRVNGGQWSSPQRMSITVPQKYVFKSLKANTIYQTKLYYGAWHSNGNFYRSSDSGIVTFRTGKAKAPKIKKIKVKAVKVKKHKKKHWYIGWFTAFRTTTKYYTYKIKVTVTLKKKPGTKYIYINGKKFKGNKKKYTFTTKKLSAYKKPKGKKYIVYVYSSNDHRYSGLSPLYKKRVKIK